MEQPTIPLSETHISKLNMRHGRKKPFIGDILPSIRKRGVRQPLLVRREGDRWGIVAGRRRWFCLQEVAKETEIDIPVPVTIMGDGDDEAIALEASILEEFSQTVVKRLEVRFVRAGGDDEIIRDIRVLSQIQRDHVLGFSII